MNDKIKLILIKREKFIPKSTKLNYTVIASLSKEKLIELISNIFPDATEVEISIDTAISFIEDIESPFIIASDANLDSNHNNDGFFELGYKIFLQPVTPKKYLDLILNGGS